MVNIDEIGEMIKRGDVEGLFSIFNRAGDWDTRETIIVAFQTMIHENRAFDRVEMIKTLRDIELVCKAETGGGTFRTNCIGVAQDLLSKLHTETRDKKDEEKVKQKGRELLTDLSGKPMDVDILGKIRRSDPMLNWLDSIDKIKQRKRPETNDPQVKKATLLMLESKIISISSKSRKGKKLQREAVSDTVQYENLLRFCIQKATPEQILEWRTSALSLAHCGITDIVYRALRIIKLCQNSILLSAQHLK